MSKTTITYRELRFVIEDELTQCYVLMECGGDVIPGVAGWHHKTFPPSMSAQDILRAWGEGDDPVMWPQKSPEVA